MLVDVVKITVSDVTINVSEYCVWDFYGIYFCPPGQAHLFIVNI